MKPTEISAEQYLFDQLNKHTKTDPLESILIQLQAIITITYTMDHT